MATDTPQPIISVSGLRGIVGPTLNPSVLARYVGAYFTWIRESSAVTDRPLRIVVGNDGRSTAPMLTDLVSRTLQACGADVLVAGVCATPTVGILVRDLKADGAIQISASHNPPPYNGMKLFGADGRVIPAGPGAEVKDFYLSDQPIDWATFDNVGTVSRLEDTTSAHLNAILKTVDAKAISAKKFKVVLDSNHASGSLLGKRLLEELGCQVIAIGDTPDGQFAHPPEPTEGNLSSVTSQALDNGADAVFCQDPDADRLAIIDQNGSYIGEEYTVALTLQHHLSGLEPADGRYVVTNCSSSRMSMDIAEKFGVKCVLSKVGEANVTDLMIEKNAVYGGEGSGGPIDPRVGFVRDSFVGMAQVLDAMAKNDCKLSDLVQQIPKYHIHKTTIKLDPNKTREEAVQEAFEKMEDHYTEVSVSRQDGFRVDWDDAWLLVRPSNTEPIVRAVAEASDPEKARKLCESAADVIA